MKPPSILEQAMRGQELATGKKRRIRKPGRQQPPLAIERSYTADLLRIVRAVGHDINELVVKQLELLTRMAGVRPTEDHEDVEDVSTMIDTIEGQLDARLNNEHLRNLEVLVRGYFNDISGFTRQQTFRQIRKAVGVDALAPEPQIQVMNELWRKEGQRLITKMTRGQIEDTMGILRRGIRNGDRPNILAEQIRERTGIAENKAKLIARDQTNKLSGQLTKMRQTNLGIESYIWRTSLDRDVRPSHIVKEGKEYRWDDPPLDTGHPGEDINCRCTAEPVIEGVPKAPMTKQARDKLREVKAEILEKTAKKPKREVPYKSPFQTTNHELRPQGERPAAMFDAMDHWVTTSVGRDAVLMKLAAKEQFKLKGVPFGADRYSFSPTEIANARRIVRRIYDETQLELAKRKIKTKRLYRGVTKKYTVRGALESWSERELKAAEFGSEVIYENVPAERILNLRGMPHWHDGFYGDEGEWVVMR